MRELSGKGWRVLGYFIWMLGVGVLLDSEAIAVAAVLLASGAGLFTLGSVQSLSSAETPMARRAAGAGGRDGEAVSRAERAEEAGS